MLIGEYYLEVFLHALDHLRISLSFFLTGHIILVAEEYRRDSLKEFHDFSEVLFSANSFVFVVHVEIQHFIDFGLLLRKFKFKKLN